MSTKMRKQIKLSLLLFIFVSFVLTYFVYHNLFNTFYQQDEWVVLGIFLHGGLHDYLSQYGILRHLRGDSRILSLLFQYPFYTIFRYQIWPFASFSIILHSLNSILSYLLIFMVGGGIFGAWIGGLFFLLSYNGSQAVSWFGTNTLTLPSLLFGAVSVLFMLLYVKKNKNTYLWLSQISALASYYFKESGFIFIILLPFFYIMSQKKRKIFWPMVRLFLPIILFVIVILITTGIRMFAPTLQIDKPTGTLSGGMVMIVKNAIYYPILSFSQLFIPFSFLTKVNPLLREISSKTDLLFIFLSGVLIILIIFSSYMLKNQRRSLLFGLIFTLLSFIPFAVLDRGASYLSSRHFYTGVLGGSILIGIYVGISYNKLSAYSGIYRRTLLGIVLALFALYAYKNIQYIQRDTYKLVLDARERKTILNQIKKSYPVLPQNPVFYITGDHPGYYFVENQKMPFQQGIGYTLMMWYYPDSNDMNNLFPLGMKYLRNISDQGYIETNGKGFGYYFSKEALQSDLTKGKFFKKDIIGYYYHSASRVLEDISLAIQKEMP